MPLPVITGVYRVTLNWNIYNGIRPANVLHFYMPSGDEDDLRANIDSAILATASPSHMFHPLPGNYTCDNIDILKLDNGSASQTRDLAHPWVGGRATNADMSPAIAAVVSLRTTQRGPRGRGRVFVGPVAEDSAGSGILSSTSQGLMLSAWRDFQDSLEAATPVTHLCVASYAHDDQHIVTSIHVPSTLATQRRRQDQLH